ncbi:MAG: tRNA uridine-5-carboxymethylaminomethyl(34) synthesis GTPase MnmE [Candidatus Latescibacteria bacterium]|nr:tRNA uridine-5-carboxymethylaminomethyl(34) synthesis GTPase MnmE [Candidatus Latescibacterota bacterium]
MPRPSTLRPHRPATETIVAIATASAPSGIGIVRLSGPDAISIGQRLFRARDPLGKCPRRVDHGLVLGGDGQEIDQGLAWVFPAPRSYTGEDTVEISCHGSLVVLEALVRAAVGAGAVLAGPGEFTRRAFLNGKMDLVQAEAVVDLIHASGRFTLDNAYGLLKGRLSAEVGEIKRELLRALAHTEALLDFPEEVAIGGQDIAAAVARTCQRCAALTATFTTFSRRQEGIGVAIIGPPNAGKSSVFNLLLKESRAIVSPIPGTTRDLIEARLYIDGELFRLVDTAGLRTTTDPIEVEGVARAHGAATEADIRLLVLDSSLPWDIAWDSMVAKLVPDRDLVVLNKSDLPRVLPGFAAAGFRVVSISALTGDGVGGLLDALRLSLGPSPVGSATGLVHLRHFDCLSRVEGYLRNAQGILGSDEIALECVAEELRAAIDQVHVLLGTQASEEVLDLVFSEFCIGK